MKAFGEKNLQPDIFCVCDDPRDAMLWVQEGLATAVFPRSMEDLCTDLPIRIIEEEKLKTRILLAWKKDRRPSAVMQDFINICEKYAGNPAIWSWTWKGDVRRNQSLRCSSFQCFHF